MKDLNLTSKQEFFKESLSRKINLFSKEKLAKYVIDLQKQCFAYKNAFISVVKNKNK